MSNHEYVKQRINGYIELENAVISLVETAEPIFSSDEETSTEYAVDGEAYDRVFEVLAAINAQRSK